MTENQVVAIVNNIRTEHKAIAICEIWTYDVWGNEEDGYDVNDKSCRDRQYEIPCVLFISNVPRFPGAADQFRKFPTAGSFFCKLVVSFDLDAKSLKMVFGVEDNGEGDDMHLYFDGDDGKPLGEIIIMGYRAIDSLRTMPTRD